MTALAFLGSLDISSLMLLFWFTLLLEIPRYAIAMVVVPIAALVSQRRPSTDGDLSVSVVVVGHNEARVLRQCIEGLAEQTIAIKPGRMEIIFVDDGSTDGTFEVARSLRDAHKVQKVLHQTRRSGKSAAVNFGISACTGEIVMICDVDSSFDRDAFSRILQHFWDPRVGAVSGNIGVRNALVSLITRHQAIEYATSITLGRSVQRELGMLSIASGAFGAFRRCALEAVGRQDVEVAEDADLTMKLRRAGWLIDFAADAQSLTDVPDTVTALIAQRLRWDRGIVTIWLRKFRGAFDFRQSTFRISDVLVNLDILVFQVLLPVVFPCYLLWLFHSLGGFAWTMIGATLVVYFVMDVLSVVAAMAVGATIPLRFIVYLPFHTVVKVTLMRVVRLVAIVQELVFFASRRDPYVPAHVSRQVEVI